MARDGLSPALPASSDTLRVQNMLHAYHISDIFYLQTLTWTLGTVNSYVPSDQHLSGMMHIESPKMVGYMYIKS